MNLPIQKYGKTERRKFGKINEVIDIPDLVEIQKESYRSFIGEGISEILEDFSPITDFSDHFELYFLSHEFGNLSHYRLQRSLRALFPEPRVREKTQVRRERVPQPRRYLRASPAR